MIAALLFYIYLLELSGGFLNASLDCSLYVSLLLLGNGCPPCCLCFGRHFSLCRLDFLNLTWTLLRCLLWNRFLLTFLAWLDFILFFLIRFGVIGRGAAAVRIEFITAARAITCCLLSARLDLSRCKVSALAGLSFDLHGRSTYGGEFILAPFLLSTILFFVILFLLFVKACPVLTFRSSLKSLDFLFNFFRGIYGPLTQINFLPLLILLGAFGPIELDIIPQLLKHLEGKFDRLTLPPTSAFLAIIVVL